MTSSATNNTAKVISNNILDGEIALRTLSKETLWNAVHVFYDTAWDKFLPCVGEEALHMGIPEIVAPTWRDAKAWIHETTNHIEGYVVDWGYKTISPYARGCTILSNGYCEWFETEDDAQEALMAAE